jgi:protein gp37
VTTIHWVRGDDGSKGKSWNPIRTRDRATGKTIGWFCVPVHDGCARCYASGLNRRFGTGHAYAAQLLDQVEFFLDEETLLEPLSWRKPLRIFAGSMTDLNGPWMRPEWKDKIRAVQALTPRHTYIELTKRPGALRVYQGDGAAPARIAAAAAAIWTRHLGPGQEGSVTISVSRNERDRHDVLATLNEWPLANVWAGPSISQQPDAEEFMPEILGTVVAKRVVSFEPLLGDINLDPWLRAGRLAIDWAILGLESGDAARERDVALIRNLLAQCIAASVRPFVKQLGSKPFLDGKRLKLRDRRLGADPAEWPADLRVRQFPIGAPPAGRPKADAAQRELPL